MSPCSRCTTASPERGQKHPAGEPLETLKRFRTALDNGDVDFGQNLIARNSGVIRWEMKWKFYPRPGEAYGQVKATIPRLRRSSRLRLPSNGRVNSLPAITSRCCWSNWNNRAFAYPIRVGRGSAAAAASGWKRRSESVKEKRGCRGWHYSRLQLCTENSATRRLKPPAPDCS